MHDIDHLSIMHRRRMSSGPAHFASNSDEFGSFFMVPDAVFTPPEYVVPCMDQSRGPDPILFVRTCLNDCAIL